MKTKLLLLTCLTLAAAAVKAQKADMAQVIVHYKFSHLRDTTKRDSFYKENMILFVGRNASAYKSYDRKLQEAMMRKQAQDQMAAAVASGGPVKINISSRRASTNEEYYQFANEKKFIRKERLINSYLVEEKMPEMAWKISADTLTIGGLHCQKATTHFKGRDYTAWFCADLPYHAGPWKLNGLPGLIVEAYDANKQVNFKFDSIDDASKMPKPEAAAPGSNGNIQVAGGGTVRMFGMEDPNADPNVIELPADGIKASEKEFANLKEAMRKDPQAFMQSAMAAMGQNGTMRVNPSSGGGSGGGPTMRMQVAPGPVINNPIELPENK